MGGILMKRQVQSNVLERRGNARKAGQETTNYERRMMNDEGKWPRQVFDVAICDIKFEVPFGHLKLLASEGIANCDRFSAGKNSFHIDHVRQVLEVRIPGDQLCPLIARRGVHDRIRHGEAMLQAEVSRQ